MYASFAVMDSRPRPQELIDRGRDPKVTNRLNLASKPFTNRALPWIVAVVVVFFSIFALALIARSTADTKTKSAAIQKEIADLNNQQRALAEEAEKVKELLTPEQQISLKSAHELVERKRFSWSRLFADLEGVLPQSVRVTRIAVRQIQNQGDRTVANLEITVFAKTPAAVTDMMTIMNKGGIFEAELRAQNLQKGRGESGSEYELNLQYTPPASFTSAADDRAANDRGKTEAGGEQ